MGFSEILQGTDTPLQTQGKHKAILGSIQIINFICNTHAEVVHQCMVLLFIRRVGVLVTKTNYMLNVCKLYITSRNS